jgi:hypothetical protein
MLSLGNARHKLERWFRGNETAPSAAPRSKITADEPDAAPTGDYDQQYRQFMEELENSSQEWLGRVRMINLDSVRERVGPAWIKLQARVELLAEKLISEEMAGRDRFVKTGTAEFLVFFADATPEESRIRCLAIVEGIHEKLFGFENRAPESLHRVAECHVIHKGDLTLDWEAESSTTRAGKRDQSPAETLRRSFRQDAELLDGADIAASTQIVLDAIISRGAESQNVGELTPLLVRLQLLSGSLKTLESALIAKKKSASRERQVDELSDRPRPEHEDANDASNDANTLPLGTAWDDIAELITVLDVGVDSSHADLLIALGRLQRERLERAAKAAAVSADRFDTENADTTQFEYVPVYRSVGRGEHIHQGIYRVNCRTFRKGLRNDPDRDVPGLSQQESVTFERLNLERAIKYLSDQKMGAHCMLMASVHVETLRGPKSQRRYSVILRAAQLRAKRRLLIEVVGYRDSDDTIGMQRAIEELRAHSHGVFVTLHKSIRNVEKVAAGCKKSGVHAVGMDLSQFDGMETDVEAALAKLSLIGKQCRIALHASGIASVSVLAKAIAGGVSYVCAPALRPALQTPDDVQLATLDDLYTAI